MLCLSHFHDNMEMGPPEESTQEGKNKTDKTSSLLLHASKSESNLFSYHSDTNSRTCSLNTANSINANIEDMVTSTPAAPSQNENDKMQNSSFRTPQSAQRGHYLFRASNTINSSSSGKRLTRSTSEVSTPSSGMRFNPFDSQNSVDRLALPTFSPSVFSIVVSPSEEERVSTKAVAFFNWKVFIDCTCLYLFSQIMASFGLSTNKLDCFLRRFRTIHLGSKKRFQADLIQI